MQSLLHRAVLPCCAWSGHSTEYLLPDTVVLHKQKASPTGRLQSFWKALTQPVFAVTGDHQCAAGSNASLRSQTSHKVMLQMAKKAECDLTQIGQVLQRSAARYMSAFVQSGS